MCAKMIHLTVFVELILIHIGGSFVSFLLLDFEK